MRGDRLRGLRYGAASPSLCKHGKYTVKVEQRRAALSAAVRRHTGMALIVVCYGLTCEVNGRASD